MDEPTLVYPKGYNHRRGCSRTHPVTHPCDNGTPVARSEPGAEGLRPARVGGYRRLTFDNGRYEEYQAVFVQHEPGEWDRILIARDDGTIAATLVALINGDATPAADSRPETSPWGIAALAEIDRLRDVIRDTPAADSRGLDVEYVMDAEHRYCVQVEGEWALGHEVERHRAQAEFIIARLTDPEPAT